MSAAGPDDQVSLTEDQGNDQPQPTSEANPQPAEPSTTREEPEDEPQETSSPPTTSTETPPVEEPSTREPTTQTSSSKSEPEPEDSTPSTSSEQPEEESSPAETASSSSEALVTSERIEASPESSDSSSSSSSTASTTSSDSSSSALSESSAFVTSTRPNASASWISVSLDETATAAAETSDDSDEGNLSTGAIIGVSVAGVVVLCLLLALLGRSKFLITKWTKRSRRASTSSISPEHSVMREAGDAYATLPGSDSKSSKEPVDFSPSPVYRQSSAHSGSAAHSGASLHSRRSSRAPPLDFDTATNAQVIPTTLASVQPAYPPLPPLPSQPIPRRQQTFSEYGRVDSPMAMPMPGPGLKYSPSLNAPSAPWEDHRASTASMSQASAPFAAAAASAPIARPAPQRSSTMPMLYTRPASSATGQWESQGMNTPIPRVSSPMSPHIASPMMHDAAYRASMRASVYVQPEEARQSRASVFDPNMMFFAR